MFCYGIFKVISFLVCIICVFFVCYLYVKYCGSVLILVLNFVLVKIYVWFM